MKMNFVVVLILTLFPLLMLSAQSIDIEQLKNNPLYEVKIAKDSVAEIYNKKTNLRWMKSIKTYTEPENARGADLIIDLDTVNFAHWANLYRKWGRINAANPLLDAKYIVTDANKNGKNEIYAIQASDTSVDLLFNGNLYENVIDSLFAYQFEIFDTVNPVYDIGDIINDEMYDVVCRSVENQLRFFRQDSSNGYIDRLNFIYNPFPPQHQPNDVAFYDLDNDGVQEIIYYLDAGPDSIWAYSNHVAKYNSAINNYELIYYHRPSPNFFTFGFATGDFDNDGKNNFSTGGIEGKYFFYEYVSANNIKVEYEMQLDTKNAFLSVMTGDMNGNGKNEIWVGSDFSSSQYGGVTRVYVLEPVGNESYEVVYQVDIRGLFSGIYGRIRYVDVNGDGIKEIFLNNGSLVFCFKYSPQRNFYLDFIIDTWEDTPGYSSDVYEGTDVADLDSDGIPEFIMQKHVEPPYQFKSLFWKRNKISGVIEDDNSIPEEFNLCQNYPNPFNPTTTIGFSLAEETKLSIKIYNILGKEIAELLNNTRTSGEYEITWNGRDSKGNEMPSGVYFITLISEKFSKTIKSIFLK